MKPDRNFERQLENLDHESNIIASYVYAEMAIQHAASKSKLLLNRLNKTPTFWITCSAALQSAAYIALGRVFDLKSPYNLNELLVSMENNLTLFSREALALRKRALGFTDEARLAEYVAAAYVPTETDIRRLRQSVKRYRAIYDRAIRPVRHQYLAHRQAHGQVRIASLYAKGKVKELWCLSVYLIRLHQTLWNQLYNGREPTLRLSRYSPKVMYDRPSHVSGPHERIVHETRELMRFIENATRNSSLKPNRNDSFRSPSRSAERNRV